MCLQLRERKIELIVRKFISCAINQNYLKSVRFRLWKYPEYPWQILHNYAGIILGNLLMLKTSCQRSLQ